MSRLQLKRLKSWSLVPRNKILVIAIARSGYHAVVHWLCKKLPGRVCFMNNCNPELKYRNVNFYENTSSKVAFHVYSFENFDLRGLKELGLQNEFEKIIIVNRDPFNWIASSMEKGSKLAVLEKPIKNNPHVIPYSKYTNETISRIDIFIQYMKQCLGEEDFIGVKFYDINYNKWFADEEYRKKICDDLQIKYTDGDMDYVPIRGGGSSFDKLKYKKRGSEMDVLNRWKEYKDNKRFLKLLTPEIREYSRRYFNFEPL